MSAANKLARRDIAELYIEHHGWLQSWLRKKLGNAADAANLAHDTFVRLLGKQHDLEIREPRAYLTRIVGGLLNDHWRRQALEQAWLETLAAQPVPLAPSPEERCLIIETLEEIARLLDGLPPRTRDIFLLSQLDGLTYPQIATQLGLTLNIVQKAMTCAVTRCYRALYPAA
ncbi:sigma-70 family RNA polymerase sigma factor [Pseudothauera rhizosphaerae]|uniref:Sigma-70 family RNA polymerase sigma factor n=1 Tax=Pseudothauera rhizosphaerae TaxID=2565932 RepID=A0A4V3WB78_9RHOO|nr:sigma-70 family RNA polymerase sigma factor [Pseudothauera rhizosphaerae]THF62046.1 sigma-70 family RNA polymerase sigma factor [Pseudothauera rhizosphaerae]